MYKEEYEINIRKNKFPFYGWIGFLLVILFWYLNWGLQGMRTQWGFFPLWFGYILVMDSFVFLRKKTSLISRNLKAFAFLFIISAPVWWLFEFFNIFLQNWHYIGKEHFSDFEYFLLASLSFSTVIPAVFSTAELMSTFKFIQKLKWNFRLNQNQKVINSFFISGVMLLTFILIFPKILYPFIWLSVYLIIEPVNATTGRNTLLQYVSKGNWTPIVALWAGCLICGFFWEMWNYFSYPKWIYTLPGVNVLHVFEMPLPGYIGYIPFSMELFAIYQLISGFFDSGLSDYVQID